jgi:large subunit ribosomal protein L4
VVDELKVAEPKTRLMASALNTLVGNNSALILIPQKEEYQDVIRSTNNLPDAKILMASYINIRDLLTFNKLVMPLAALESISAHLG